VMVGHGLQVPGIFMLRPQAIIQADHQGRKPERPG